MSQKNATATLIDRTPLKNGRILYEFASASKSNYTYFFTMTDGSIDEGTHEDCEGYRYRGQCCHAKRAYDIEFYNFNVASARQMLETTKSADLAYSARKKLAQATKIAEAVYAAPVAEIIGRTDTGLDEAIDEFLNPYKALAATKHVSTATYGTCGHLSKNPDDECPSCRAKLWK